MKKALILSLVLAIMAGLLVSCAGQSNKQGSEKDSDTKAIDTTVYETISSESQEGSMKETKTNNTEETSIEVNEHVLMQVHYYDESEDEFTLSAEHAAFVKEIFCSNKMETIESPLASIATVVFQIDGKILSTSMGNLPILDGVIDGKLVMVELSDSECQQLQEVIETYVTDLNLVP